jgi:ferric-dicitrate binding protein FerR (iron transport regulator)
MIMTGRKWWGALTLLATLISSRSFASGPLVESRALGMVMTSTPSAVMINGAPMRSGTTLFRGDVIETRSAATAQVKLRSGASLALSENSEVALQGADPAAGTEKLDLRRGALHLRNPNPQAEWVTVPGAAVLVQSEGGFPAICRIAAVGQSAAIINDRGRVEIRGSGAPLILPLGQYATLEAGRPQGGSQAAGTVSAAIPKETVTRSGQATPAPLKVQDPVYFQDVVRTLNTGRVRIALQDGSLLNIGARAEMKIMKHNAQTHQTAIELTAGKLRSQVVHKDGTNFDVTTQTAVIGVVGTDFLVDADKKKTRVWCIEGLVRVRNVNPAIVGLILLHAGEFTTIPLGMAPAAVTSVSTSTVQTQISQTNPSGPPPSAGLGSMANVANVGTAGASAGAAAGAGVAVGRANNASILMDQAGTILNGAYTDLNNANNNANNALNNANGANQSGGNTNGLLNGVLQSLVSPTYPCGCH